MISEMIAVLKKFIKKHFKNFTFFYQYLQHRIFIAIGLNIFVGVLDSFGLAMLLPLLQLVSDGQQDNSLQLGKFNFLIDPIEKSGVPITIFSVLFLFALFFILKGVIKFISLNYTVIIRQFFIKKLRIDQLSNFNQISYKHYITSDAGMIQNNLTTETEKVQQSSHFFFKTFESVVLIMVYMGFALIVDWQFAIMVAIGGGATNFIYKAAYIKTKGSSIALTQESHLFHGLILQYISQFKYLKATAQIEKFQNKLEKCIDAIEINRKTIGKLSAILGSLREPLMIIIISLIIIIQVSLLKGQLGSVVISLLFFYRALQSLMMLQNAWNQFLANTGSIQAIIQFDKKNRSNREKSGGEEFPKNSNLITFKNMYFSYETKEVLKDINLTINQNETVAIIGESGSGKTTLMNIFAGLLPADSGEVLIYGKKIKDIDVRKYQKTIGYITQDSVIFSDSIFNNVSFWDTPSDTNKLRCQNSLKQAALLNFVMTLPDKENTLLGNNGINLSGGQKQRISIARELYKNIDVLFMDEATSSLDSETEQVIQESIKQLKGQYTLLIVAHRLSTIKHADKIVILNEGKIIDMGNYQELLSRNLGFKKMIAMQQLQAN